MFGQYLRIYVRRCCFRIQRCICSCIVGYETQEELVAAMHAEGAQRAQALRGLQLPIVVEEADDSERAMCTRLANRVGWCARRVDACCESVCCCCRQGCTESTQNVLDFVQTTEHFQVPVVLRARRPRQQAATAPPQERMEPESRDEIAETTETADLPAEETTVSDA